MQDNSSQYNSENSLRIRNYLIKGTIVAVVLVAIILNSIYGFALPHSQIDCIIDNTQLYTSSLNSYFNENIFTRQLSQICSSLLVDATLIACGVMWITSSKSWRFLVTLFGSFLFKCFVQLIFLERSPDGNIWSYPGFPSITVSYLQSNDFFFALPVCFMIIVTLESLRMDNKLIFITSVVANALQIIARISMRGNYIIDIFSALVIGHFIFMLSDELCGKYLDNLNWEWLNSKEEYEILKSEDIEEKEIEINQKTNN